MKIRPRIPIFQGGGQWWAKLSAYDPKNYISSWAPEKGLIAGDTSKGILPAWSSKVAGTDPGRYTPTNLNNYNKFGKSGSHYKYAEGVEGQDNYKTFMDAMFDAETGKITDVGMQWIKDTDKLLPENHSAKLLNPDGTFRNNITVKLRDAHGRAPETTTFNPQNPQELKAYIEHVMRDQTIGGRHNIFQKEGKRYFYKDAEGVEHWVNPDEIGEYEVSKDPVRSSTEGITTWNDYELTGLKKVVDTPAETPEEEKKEKVFSTTPEERKDKETIWDKLGQNLGKVAPDLLDALRLGINLHNNNRVFDTMMKGIKPNLQQSYNTYRQVVGDEATKQAYYRRAAQGEQKAARPITSDLDKQIAYQNEAKRIGDELRAQGDLADNQRIRETSDESNQHSWGNTQRATEVANHNIMELNQANAAKRQLEAQKYSADTTNIDNWLMGIQNKYEQKKAKQDYINDQINTLHLQDYLENDESVKQAYDNLQAIIKKKKEEGNNNYLEDPEVLAASSAYKKARRQSMIKGYKLYYSKRGSKLNYTRDDEYLYKTSRDIVEHFRKMSKMTDDSRIRSKSKLIKLSSHPKKYQQGGIAPFTIYRPLSLMGNSQSASYQTDSAGTKNSTKNEQSKAKLDMVKEFFKELKGLPVDVTLVYNELDNLFNHYKLFGEEMSTDDIASVYLKAMNRLSELSYNQNSFDKAKTLVTQNEGLNEYAVGTDGRMILQDLDTGKIVEGSVKQWLENKDKLNPLTNSQVLDLRAHSSKYAFNNGLMSVVENGVGLNKISAQIKALAASLGQTENQLEGISEVESGKIKEGLKILASTKDTPDGHYKITQNEKQSQEQISAALNYIYNMLPNNYKTILELHSDGKGKSLIKDFLTSQSNYSYKENITPSTGTAGDKNSNGSDGKGASENSAGLAFVLGQGPRVPVVFNTGTSYQITANGIQGVFQNKSNENLGQGATLQDATKSQQGGYFQWNKATFGGSRLIPTAFSHIILNDSTIIGVDLPYKKGIDGNEIPDFQQLKRMEEADQEIRQKGIQSNDYNAINQIYQNHQLQPKYNQEGKLNKQDYRRFAVIQATLDENSLQNKNAILSDEVAIASEVERDLYNEAMRKITGNNKFELDEGWPIFGGGTKLYKGSIFVPYYEDKAFAALSSGKPFNVDLPNNSSTVQLMQYAPATLTYKPQDVTVSQIKNN